MKKNQICLFWVTLYIITAVLAPVYRFDSFSNENFQMLIVAFITPWILLILLYVLKRQLPDHLLKIWFFFNYFAGMIGSGLGAYQLPFFDKIVHFISGLIVSYFAVILFYTLKIHSNRPKFAIILWIVMFSAVIGVYWEFFEYAMLIFFNNDAIHHYDSGVHDSLRDMLSAASATWLFIIYYFQNKKSRLHRQIIETADLLQNSFHTHNT